MISRNRSEHLLYERLRSNPPQDSAWPGPAGHAADLQRHIRCQEPQLRKWIIEQGLAAVDIIDACDQGELFTSQALYFRNAYQLPQCLSLSGLQDQLGG